MNRKWQIPRRTFLKGLGTVISLPLLEAMVPPARLLAAAAPRPALPRRLAFVYVPNGVNMADWTPKTVGTDFEFPSILEPLTPFRKDLQVLTGLAHDKARANGDGAGDHARASATFLTGCQARKTAAADIRVGVSVDQIAAEKLGPLTRLKSLELACEAMKRTGNCDSGYSCAYQSSISWKTESMPLPPEIDPRKVFERLFTSGRPEESRESRTRRQLYQKSILDFAMDDARQLQSNLGQTDRRKLDEYLTAVRELEIRIEQAEKFAAALPDYDKPSGIPDGPNSFEEHARLMLDLMTLAFQTDTTRVASFMLSYDGSDRTYRNLGISDGHHYLSHHGGDADKIRKIAGINRFHATQFAHLLERLKSTPEGDGNLLDQCMVVYGSGISDGNRHNHDDLPVLLAGRGGGTLTPGRHVRLERETPMTNLFISMLDRVGIQIDRIGDSSGPLKNI